MTNNRYDAAMEKLIEIDELAEDEEEFEA